MKKGSLVFVLFLLLVITVGFIYYFYGGETVDLVSDSESSEEITSGSLFVVGEEGAKSVQSLGSSSGSSSGSVSSSSDNIQKLSSESSLTEYRGVRIVLSSPAVLEDVSVSNYLNSVSNGGSLDVKSVGSKVAEIRKNLNSEREIVKNQIENIVGKNVEIKSSNGFVSNSYVLEELDYFDSAVAELEKLPSVKEVVPNFLYHPTLVETIDLINADQVWEMSPEGESCKGSSSLGGSSGDCLLGDGVQIGIIDTGIDYTHPDLGGCTTEEFLSGDCEKVRGGWDFADGDSDPMDQISHGTHVASTAAGNGDWNGDGIVSDSEGLNGIAPGATLYALKVFSNTGGSTEAEIVAAIEMAFDLDRDGYVYGVDSEEMDPNDILDIISLSLGRDCAGYYPLCGPDDSLSRKLDLVMDSGIFVSVSAGNSGRRGSATIGSPGTSREAMTVGAVYKMDYEPFWYDCSLGGWSRCSDTCGDDGRVLCDYDGLGSASEDQLAVFSSMGPVAWTDLDGVAQQISKPDIVAPGAYICAARYDGAYEYGIHPYYHPCKDDEHILMAGTSMSAPVVTGAAALMIEQHPTWAPAQVKQAMKQGAEPLEGYSIDQVGAGRVDSYAAHRIRTVPIIVKLFVPDVLRSDVDVRGSIFSDSFERYTVEIRRIGSAEWTLLKESFEMPELGVLIDDLDTSTILDGDYVLRLSAYGSEGSYGFVETEVEVDNVYIESPFDRSGVALGANLEILGGVSMEGFREFKVEWSKVAHSHGDSTVKYNPKGISLSGQGSSEISSGLIAMWDTSVVPGPGFYNVRLSAKSLSGESVHVVEGLYLENYAGGFPFNTGIGEVSEGDPWDADYYYIGVQSSPVVEDLDGDGSNEIIFMVDNIRSGALMYISDDFVYVLNSDGSLREGWPQQVGWWQIGSPLVADVDDDPTTKEIISMYAYPGCEGGYKCSNINVWKHDGSVVEGWPLYTVGMPNSIADVDNDGSNDILIENGWATGWVDSGMIIGADQVPLEGFGIEDPLVSSPIGDLDNYGGLEMFELVKSLFVATDSVQVRPKHQDNQLVYGWPANVRYGDLISLGGSTSTVRILQRVLGDLDNDGDLEVVAPVLYSVTHGSEKSYSAKLMVYDHEGNVLPGWPFELDDFAGSPNTLPSTLAVMGDIDGDGDGEIVIGYNPSEDDVARLYAFDLDGSVVEGWPVEVDGLVIGRAYKDYSSGGNFENSPIIGDVDGDAVGDVLVSVCQGVYGYSVGSGGTGVDCSVYAWNGDGDLISGWPKTAPQLSGVVPSIGDVDSDGLAEVLLGSGRYGILYAWETEGVFDENDVDWPMLWHDSQHTSCYNCDLVGEDVEPHSFTGCSLETGCGEIVALSGSDSCTVDESCYNLVEVSDAAGDVLPYAGVPEGQEGFLDIEDVAFYVDGANLKVVMDLVGGEDGSFEFPDEGDVYKYSASVSNTLTGDFVRAIVRSDGSVEGSRSKGDVVVSLEGSRLTFFALDYYIPLSEVSFRAESQYDSISGPPRQADTFTGSAVFIAGDVACWSQPDGFPCFGSDGGDGLCLDEKCLVGSSCVGLPDGSICDDGVYCNGADECSSGVCVNLGPVISCDDSVECTHDSCDEVENVCVNELDDSICSGFAWCRPELGGCSDVPFYFKIEDPRLDVNPDPLVQEHVDSIDLKSVEFALSKSFFDVVFEFWGDEFGEIPAPREGHPINYRVDMADEYKDHYLRFFSDGSMRPFGVTNVRKNGNQISYRVETGISQGVRPGDLAEGTFLIRDDDPRIYIEAEKFNGTIEGDGVQCVDSLDCDDLIDCTVDSCLSGVCEFVVDDSFCSEGFVCQDFRGCVSSDPIQMSLSDLVGDVDEEYEEDSPSVDIESADLTFGFDSIDVSIKIAGDGELPLPLGDEAYVYSVLVGGNDYGFMRLSSGAIQMLGDGLGHFPTINGRTISYEVDTGDFGEGDEFWVETRSGGDLPIIYDSIFGVVSESSGRTAATKGDKRGVQMSPGGSLFKDFFRRFEEFFLN